MMQATKLLYCYAREDRQLRENLARQLAPLNREGLITEWSDRDIGAGIDWQKEIDKHLNEADIILLLISADFIHSDYCYSKEMQRALERHGAGKARVIPIILRPADWGNLPFAKLQVLPTDAKPITTWTNRDTAWLDVVQGIRKVIETFLPAPDVCPYLGLENFTENDHQFFFGRDRDSDKLLRKLRRGSHFMAVLGPSGSGKSSLVHAGLTVRLKKGEIPGSANWKFITSRPLTDPFAQLAEQGLDGPSNNLLERVQAWRNQHPEKEQRLVLVLDQFEELWTNCPELAPEFLAQLIQLLQAPYHEYITIIVIMRDDFYQYSVRNEQFADLMEQGIVNISPQLKQEEFVDIIQKPAHAVGLRFADGLVHAILADLGMVTTPVVITTPQGSEEEEVRLGPSTILPLLEFALKQLWEQRQHEELTLSAYIAIQGVSGALAQWAEIAFVNHIEERLHPLARHIFTELVYLDEKQEHPKSRRRKTLNSLCPGGGNPNDVHQVVSQLAKDRLLVTNRDKEGQEWVEIIHDVLLQEWKLLRSWIENDHRFLLWRQELEHQLQLWIATNPQDPEKRSQAKLLRDTDLTEAEKWLEERAAHLGQEEQDFIQASRAREAQEQQRWKAMSDKTLARQLADQAETLLDQQPDLLERSVLLAVEAMHRYPCVETYQALSRGLSLLHPNLPLRASLVHPTGVLRFSVNIVKCSPCDDTVATVYGEEVHIWTALDNRLRKQINLIGKGSLLDSSPVGQYLLAFSPNGQRLVAGCDDHCARVWDLSNLSTIHELFILPHEDGEVNAVAISPDSHYIATAGSDHMAKIWDITGGTKATLIATLAHKGLVNSVAFSPNGCYLATASDDGYAHIWDFSIPTEIHLHCTFPHKGGVNLVAFSPGGNYVATTVQDMLHQIHIWNILDHNKVASMKYRGNRDSNNIWAIAFSPDEKLLASTEGSEVKVWNVGTGEQLTSLLHEATMHDVAFSPDGNYLIVPAGPSVHIWRATSADLIGRIVHKDSVNAIAFSYDGRYLATASGNTAQLWLWQPEDLIEEACQHVTRNLTLEEWQMYLNDEPYRNTCTIRTNLDTNALLQSKQKRSDAIIRRATRAVGLAERTPYSIQQIIPGIDVTVQYVLVPHPDFPDSPGSFKVTDPTSSQYFRGTVTDTVRILWDLCIEALNKASEDTHRELHDQLNVLDNTFEAESK